MYYISQKYTDFHNILLLDEIMSFNENEQLNIADWSDLDTFRTNIDFLIALNPQACSLSFGMCSIFFKSKNFLFQWEEITGQIITNRIFQEVIE